MFRELELGRENMLNEAFFVYRKSPFQALRVCLNLHITFERYYRDRLIEDIADHGALQIPYVIPRFERLSQ